MSSFWGLSVLPKLVCLLPSGLGKFSSFLQVSFQFLVLISFWYLCDANIGTLDVVPEDPLKYSHFWGDSFFLLLL